MSPPAAAVEQAHEPTRKEDDDEGEDRPKTKRQ